MRDFREIVFLSRDIIVSHKTTLISILIIDRYPLGGTEQRTRVNLDRSERYERTWRQLSPLGPPWQCFVYVDRGVVAKDAFRVFRSLGNIRKFRAQALSADNEETARPR